VSDIAQFCLVMSVLFSAYCLWHIAEYLERIADKFEEVANRDRYGVQED